MTKSRKFKKEYAQELLAIAEQDLQTANILIAADLPRKENILFHIEQTIEKAIKAVLCRHGIAVPLVHELAILMDKLPQDLEVPEGEQVVDLTQFATIRRYEEGRADLSKEEIAEAYALARKILIWAKKT